MSVEIAVIGTQRPFVLEALKSEYQVHNLIEAQDKVAALGRSPSASAGSRPTR